MQLPHPDEARCSLFSHTIWVAGQRMGRPAWTSVIKETGWKKKSRRDNGLDEDGETESKNDGQCGGWEKEKGEKHFHIRVCMCETDSPVCCNECAGAKREQYMCSLIGFGYPSLYWPWNYCTTHTAFAHAHPHGHKYREFSKNVIATNTFRTR